MTIHSIFCFGYYENETESIALMEAASPDLEKQGFSAVVFIYRKYSGQQDGS
ncbi:hypothetical protein [Flavobacterium sp. 120]|uniref:hypothetical protein n=1 Tax=Flavobacterium sp. 120 TaxID=2135626 RepID=UPI000F13FCD6|nr:hypothetical protein [Flavobacterium sp. 120]RKS14954.1 hypothetical protein C8C87_2262 [Flavobacterium sp. 120]